MQSAPKCTANNAGWNDKAVQEIVRIPITVKHRGVDTTADASLDRVVYYTSGLVLQSESIRENPSVMESTKTS
ncbi:hypothetical protein GH101_21905 [Escherichia coli]|nr:hypothetical protein [Escherichia coli]